MNRNKFFKLVDEKGVIPALEVAGHDPIYIGASPLGGGEMGENYRCLKCGQEPEFVFANGTRNDERDDHSLHGFYGLNPIECSK